MAKASILSLTSASKLETRCRIACSWARFARSTAFRADCCPTEYTVSLTFSVQIQAILQKDFCFAHTQAEKRHGKVRKPPAQLCRQGFRSKPSRAVGMHGRAIDALEQTRSVSRPVIFAAALAKDAVHASPVSRDKTKWMQRSDHAKTEQNSLSRKKAVRVYLIACSPAAVPATLLCVSSMLPISDPKKPPITADGGSFFLPPSPLPPPPFLSPPWWPS